MDDVKVLCCLLAASILSFLRVVSSSISISNDYPMDERGNQTQKEAGDFLPVVVMYVDLLAVACFCFLAKAIPQTEDQLCPQWQACFVFSLISVMLKALSLVPLVMSPTLLPSAIFLTLLSACFSGAAVVHIATPAGLRLPPKRVSQEPLLRKEYSLLLPR